MKKPNIDDIIKTLEIMQKDVFNIKKAEKDLILLFQYPTAKVNTFYSSVEKMFDVDLTIKPYTLNEMAKRILEKDNEKKWWE